MRRAVSLGIGWVLGAAGCGRLEFDRQQAPVSDADLGPQPASFRNLCSFERFTVIENGIPIDDAAASSLTSALAAGCRTQPTVRRVSQDAAGVLDPTTDRPLLAVDELGIIGGGDGPNRGLAYLLHVDTPLTWSGGGDAATIRERSTGRTIVTGPTSPQHDYAFVMVVVEPISGAQILSAQGFGGRGTQAASYWFATAMAPTIGELDGTWTVVEWTNVDGDPAPSADDTFTVLESSR